MVFVMLFSLASAYEKFQVISSSSSITKQIDSAAILGVQSDARMAQGAANDPTVVALEALPWIGHDIHAARVLAIGIHENLQVIVPLMEQRDALTLGQADVPKTIKALAGSMDSLDTAIAKFSAELKTVKVSELHFGLSQKVGKLQKTVSTVKTAIHEGAPLLKTAAILLNQPGKTRWFVATQNAAELRASGGLLGSFAVITIDQGKIKLEQFGADSKLLAKGKLHVDFESGVGNQWGADLSDWRDLNVSSHIPDVGQIIKDAWKEKFHQELDGVLFFSQGTVAHLVGAVEQIKIYNETLTSENTVDFLTKTIYEKFPNVKKKNAVVSELMNQLFTRLSSSKITISTLFASLSNQQNQDQIYMWSKNRETQQIIEKFKLDGGVGENLGSEVVIGLNNAGGNKLDAYLISEYSYVLGSCNQKTWDEVAGRKSTVTVTLTNNAPKSGLPNYVNPRLDLRPGQKWVPGSNREMVSIYAPIGSTDEVFKLDGQEVGAGFGESQMHPLYTIPIELAPGQTKKLEVTFIEPIVDASGKSIQKSPRLRVQRTLAGTKTVISSGSFCSVD